MAAEDYEILDERFRRSVPTSARVEKLFEGSRWAEGPAYFAAGRHLIWSNSPNDVIVASDGAVWFSDPTYDPDGTLIGKMRIPEAVANVAFGGPKRTRLFICATTSLYAVLLAVNGATRA